MRLYLVLGLVGFAVGFVATSRRDRFGELKAACASGDNARACEQLGALVEKAPLYPEEPGLYLALACDGGDRDACPRAQAIGKTYGGYEMLGLDVDCMVHGSPSACEQLANGLRGAGIVANEADPNIGLPLARSRMKRALNLYLKGCTANEADACLGASRVYASGFGIEWNLRTAYTYEAKACELGLAEACERQADDTPGVDAVALYRKACTSHSPHACLRLAQVEEASAQPQSVIDASYRRACELLAFDACEHVSHVIASLDRESPRLVNAFTRWCDAGNTRACELVK